MRYNDERIIPKFFYQSLNGKKITIYSDGKQTRSYCHIFDAVVMILHVIFKGKKFVYNIGNPIVGDNKYFYRPIYSGLSSGQQPANTVIGFLKELTKD